MLNAVLTDVTRREVRLTAQSKYPGFPFGLNHSACLLMRTTTSTNYYD